jgi:hypothetical protein
VLLVAVIMVAVLFIMWVTAPAITIFDLWLCLFLLVIKKFFNE